VVLGDDPEAALAVSLDPVHFPQSRDPVLAAGDALTI
jgi:hypothetical protein